MQSLRLYHSIRPVKALLSLFLASLIISACYLPVVEEVRSLAGAAPDQNVPIPSAPTRTPFQPLPAEMLATTSTPTAVVSEYQTDTPQPVVITALSPTSVPDPARLSLWIDPSLPPVLRSGLHLPAELSAVDDVQNATLRVGAGGGPVLTRWVYALVAPFPTIVDGISFEALRRAWTGEPAGPFAGRPLLLDESTLAVWSATWGAPVAGAVQVFAPGDMLAHAWQTSTWALIPFELLEPRWKVLRVEGFSPLDKNFDLAAYPLSAPVSLAGDPVLVEAIATLYGPNTQHPLLPISNRDPNRLTVVAMTGVTALVRATAFAMEQRGVLYPAQDIGDLLRNADITHISNEVPFAENCPSPDPFQADMRFCSDVRYLELLESIGADIIELTGDHFQDYGTAAMGTTLELYREKGWQYYGGGENLDDARRAATIEHNGNRLAFIGCNRKGGGYAQASADHPGAGVCDMDWMQAEIARLRSQGYLPMATFQHFEYYTYRAQPDQIADSRLLAEAGAVIVSGSQAHQPQGLEFTSGALIHYGLGNLFFDQYDVSEACRQGLIDYHVFYDGRYLSTELLPILFIDYARPRPMTPEEKADLFRALFRASGW